jgi:hypothetical protein
MVAPPAGGEPYPEPINPPPAPGEEYPIPAPLESPPPAPFDDTGRPTDILLAQVKLSGCGPLPFTGGQGAL